MPNFNKLFTLDSESIDILKSKDNQSKFVRDAIKRFNDMKDTKLIPDIENPQIKVKSIA